MATNMNFTSEDQGHREAVLKNIHRIVVKVGTNLLRHPEIGARVEELVAAVADLRRSGHEVIIVSSGAVGVGMTECGMTVRPKNVSKVQALAAIGQCSLMSIYKNACQEQGFHCAQLLLTAADLQDFERNQRVIGCLDALLDEGILPVINENDSVCVDEIKVGDNDTLAAYVAAMVRADLTILLTTVDGLHETDEAGNLGRRISVVEALDDLVMKMAKGTDGNQFSTGGMLTKLRAAGIVMSSGAPMIIADGADFRILGQILAGKDLGTLFVPVATHLHKQQRFLAFFSEPKGILIVDDGAVGALVKNNRSLLPGGVLGVRGSFLCGDPVSVVDLKGREIARGIVNFNMDDAARICGARTADLPAILGRKVAAPEMIHKDHLVCL